MQSDTTKVPRDFVTHNKIPETARKEENNDATENRYS